LLSDELLCVLHIDEAERRATEEEKEKRKARQAIALQILIYPVLDHSTDRASYRDEKNQLLLSTKGMQWCWDQYIPRLIDREHMLASPLRADLKKHPSVPAIVVTAGYDVLKDEADLYCEALRQAGVPLRHTCFEDQMHGFLGLAPFLKTDHDERALQFIRSSMNALLSPSIASASA
jgi:acetyl esterase